MPPRAMASDAAKVQRLVDSLLASPDDSTRSGVLGKIDRVMKVDEMIAEFDAWVAEAAKGSVLPSMRNRQRNIVNRALDIPIRYDY